MTSSKRVLIADCDGMVALDIYGASIPNRGGAFAGLIVVEGQQDRGEFSIYLVPKVFAGPVYHEAVKRLLGDELYQSLYVEGKGWGTELPGDQVDAITARMVTELD